MRGRLTAVTAALCVAAGTMLPVGSCDVDDYDPQAVGAEADFIDSFRFSIDIPQTDARLTLRQKEQGGRGNLGISTGAGGFTGTLSPGDNRIVFDAGSEIDAEAVNFWSDAPESISLAVEAEILIEEEFPVLREYFPSRGTFTVSGGGEVVTAVFTAVSGVPGVSLSVNGSTPVQYTIDAFEDFIGSSAEVWKRRASLCFFILEHLIDQVFFAADTVDIIEAHGGNLAASGSITFLCDSLVPGSEQDPLEPEYTRTLDWTDVNGSGLPDSGDSFRWIFFECWENDLGDLMGDLVEGVVEFSGYVVEREERDGRQAITGFGFAAGPGEPVGVLYDDFDWITVEEEFPGSFTYDPFRSFTIDGGFDLVFDGLQQ